MQHQLHTHMLCNQYSKSVLFVLLKLKLTKKLQTSHARCSKQNESKTAAAAAAT